MINLVIYNEQKNYWVDAHSKNNQKWRWHYEEYCWVVFAIKSVFFFSGGVHNNRINVEATDTHQRQEGMNS